MEITLYNNSSDNRVVSKTIAQIKNTDCKMYEDCDVQNPSFILAYDEALFKANYCYIPKFCRYYYINDVTIQNGRQIKIDCHVDVLMSFDVRSLNAIVGRNTNQWNLYYEDKQIPNLQYNSIDIKKFPVGFTENSLIFTLAGGGN